MKALHRIARVLRSVRTPIRLAVLVPSVGLVLVVLFLGVDDTLTERHVERAERYVAHVQAVLSRYPCFQGVAVRVQGCGRPRYVLVTGHVARWEDCMRLKEVFSFFKETSSFAVYSTVCAGELASSDAPRHEPEIILDRLTWCLNVKEGPPLYQWSSSADP